MQRAEKKGPRPDDPDWLLVETMMACAARMEAASPMTEKALESFAERLERVEQGVDDLAKQPAAVPAIPSDLSSSMARLAEQLRYAAAASAQADPIPVISRYVTVFAVGFLVAETAGLMLLNGWIPASFDRLFAFGCGLTLTAFVLLYIWLAPIVTGRGGRSG
jgi:hypothetical protein